MMIRVSALAFILFGLLFSVHAARSLALADESNGKRIALVIGNNAYQHVDILEKAANDAIAMGRALEKIGYVTTVLTDANRRSMNAAVNNFVDEISGGGQGVLFFAGHGVQINSQNYLLPIDIDPPRREADIADQAINLQSVQDKLAEAKARFALLVIDACRNNPLPKKAGRTLGGTRGLAQASSAEGQMVVFSAGANQQALDKLTDGDRDPNGVFTREFLPWIEKPGVRVRDAILEVRRNVHAKAKSVNHDQLPAVYDQVLGDFYFKSGTSVANVNHSLPSGPTTPSTTGFSLNDLKQEAKRRADWSSWQQRMQADHDKVKNLKVSADLKAKAWERFLAAYPQDNPYSDDDERLRSETKLPKITPPPVKAAIIARPLSMDSTRSGHIFRDCPKCPDMVIIPSGEFNMGHDDGPKNERPVHRVALASFALSKTEITQAQWLSVMGTNPSTFRNCGNDCPVENISWNEAHDFVKKLNLITGQRYRLPSEAEWEYACESGRPSQYCGGNNLDENGWYEKQSMGTTHTVATKHANEFGIYDMSGNVWEWTEDCYHPNYVGAPNNGASWSSDDCEMHVLRGASWNNDTKAARYTNRNWYVPHYRDNEIGLRIARESPR